MNRENNAKLVIELKEPRDPETGIGDAFGGFDMIETDPDNHPGKRSLRMRIVHWHSKNSGTSYYVEVPKAIEEAVLDQISRTFSDGRRDKAREIRKALESY